MEKIKVLIADDVQVIAESNKKIAQAFENMEVLGIAKNGQEEYNMIDGISSFHSGYVNGTWEVSGACINNGVLYLMSFDGKNLLKIDVSTMKFEVEDTGLSQHYVAMFPEKEGMERYWLLPYEGTVVTCLDLSIGEAKEYDLKVEGLKAFYPGRNVECAEHFFSSIAEYDGYILLRHMETSL